MKYHRGDGDTVYVPAPANVVSGDGLKIGVALFGICGASALQGERLALWCTGEYEVPKMTNQTWTLGEVAYWDVATKTFSNANTSGNTKVGSIVAAAAASASTGIVRLNGAI